MADEDRWAQQKEWDEEKRRGFDVEIKLIVSIVGEGNLCQRGLCKNYATRRYCVGEVATKGGIDVDLCPCHDSEEIALEEYGNQIAG